MRLEMADQGGSIVMRDYRKGNWTVSETMVLIEAKKMDDERRMKRSGDGEGRSKPAELRWKWVEDYCWRRGCQRSQNQCNDKWDNLMRDYKKVREYERRVAETGDGGGQQQSYWKLEKSERKERNLPTNMLPEIYDALVGVVERKGALRITGASNPTVAYVSENPITNVQLSLPPILQPHHIPAPVPTLPLPQQPSAPPPPLPPPSPLPPPQPTTTATQPSSLPSPQPSPPLDSDTSEYSDSPAKRRRRGRGEGTSGSSSNEVGTAISRSASIIAEALQACEEREERRHRDLLSLHERRLKIEESKTEISREGINGLVDAINKLANSILALATRTNPRQSE